MSQGANGAFGERCPDCGRIGGLGADECSGYYGDWHKLHCLQRTIERQRSIIAAQDTALGAAAKVASILATARMPVLEESWVRRFNASLAAVVAAKDPI